MKLSVSRVSATIIVALGLIVVFTPKYIFPICESDQLGFFSSYEPIMRCFWFGRIELFLGGLVVLCGLILLYRSTPEGRFVIGVLLAGLGLVVILVSVNAVIGSTCGHVHSICQIGTKPAERIAGGLVIISGVFLVVFSGKRCEKK